MYYFLCVVVKKLHTKKRSLLFDLATACQFDQQLGSSVIVGFIAKKIIIIKNNEINFPFYIIPRCTLFLPLN